MTSVDGLSFATDLLFNVEQVEDKCRFDVKEMDALLTMMKARVALEKHYATELNKLAESCGLAIFSTGTMQNSMLQLTAQYKNTSIQHKQYAQSIQEDVVVILEQEFKSKSKLVSELSNNAARLSREGKAKEDAYRKSFKLLDRRFNDAVAIVSNTMEDSRVTKEELEEKFKQHAFKQRKETSGNNQRLVGWLLSDGKSDDELARAFWNAEFCRQNVLKDWKQLEMARREQYRTIQTVLNDYQELSLKTNACIESCVRKKVVYESSLLANLQYDWQRLSQVFETMDPEQDLVEFINATQTMMVRESWSLQTLCERAAIEPLPNPPEAKPLTIEQICNKTLPRQVKGASKPLKGFIVTRDMDTDNITLASLDQTKQAVKAVNASTSCLDRRLN